ncbi:MAG: TonB-dependent receptor domain-containing protein [Flammeovirgaceae bacterium]
MKLKDFSCIASTIMLFLISFQAFADYKISGIVTDQVTNQPISEAEIYIAKTGKFYKTNKRGIFQIEHLPIDTYEIQIFAYGYHVLKQAITVSANQLELNFKMEKLQFELSEVVISQQLEEVFALKRLRQVEGTAIYAGKKNEVVLLDQIVGNIASNNARQIYGQVTGLNIYEADDAGLQLNIGGRGLDPNRTANFNTRQNGYDISADVLGYPESYYTPPAEALSEIQVIRGAASLQYGTQFGGLVNFKLKKPNPNKKIELISRQAIGSNNLFTSFNSLGGTVGKVEYYTYFNYKKGDGFRPNSSFDSKNLYAYVNYNLGEFTDVSVEFTYLNYLAQQAGGLTDAQFYNDPFTSNRTRNWFEVDWKLASVKFEHKFSAKTDLSVNLFGLDASRKAVGFRTNRVSQEDDLDAPRDLLIGEFNNWGVETRLLHRYRIKNRDAIFLIGNKYYQSRNAAIQGPGTNGGDANFNLATAEFPFYRDQSDFTFPNINLALFGENIFYLSDNFSLTPGFRLEHIRTESEGTFRKIDFDLAGNPIRDATFDDNRDFNRTFVLLGIGASFTPKEGLEVYGNISQNYRSVTFNDIQVVNPSFQVDPNITDESGFTADVGVRGKWKGILSYDFGGFALLYDDRLGEVLRAEERLNADGELVQTGRIIRFRGNIGRALMYGIESLFDWNVAGTLFKERKDLRLNIFLNTAITRSNYLQSQIPGVEGNEVEFIPLINHKSGIRFGYKNLLGSLQFTYLSKQFTDASNAEQDLNDNQSGIRGSIPAYHVMDFSLSYRFKRFKVETGLNNVLNNTYFTRRATGYPGPGIIPSAPRVGYVAVQVKL